ncbi:helicase-exonuclease AddAB subunit AddA [Zongyangia hominis]|uniref:DNA 3'-5' helicase n=1 Tax=Zongyangia hominis TaxID=2763677 RepID=A0A926ECI4_9FIRM|nr:helicase-exonuclease AddAB subunit AddA [Zongyangia hominis]MBC8569247.1 helicase-exonuclease AddAB subunit AddA [Zongyangia hominis]
MAVNWTPMQHLAITAGGGPLLVSAAAGSGKTAVLVQRIIEKITDSEHPVDVDRLLVVTFSNAAAAEMRARIGARISELLALDGTNPLLLRQQTLLSGAHISTVHAFCLELIRQNFMRLDLPADFRIADEYELTALRADALSDVMERYYEEEGQPFYDLVELFSSTKNDSRLQEIVGRLYNFVISHPFYEDWLDEKLRYYEDAPAASDSVWGKIILSHAKETVERCGRLTRRAIERMAGIEAMEKAYLPAFLSDAAQLEELEKTMETAAWDEIIAALSNVKFQKLGQLRGFEDAACKDWVQGVRKSVKEDISTLLQKQFCASEKEFQEDLRELAPHVRLLFALVKDFGRRFSERKLQRNLIDFSDIEQMTLRLLTERTPDGFQRTDTAKELSEAFDEILVDEYQDTSGIQDMIFRYLSREETNLFMVGDVKQSIYRFRQAMPELFLRRKNQYADISQGERPAKIILQHNFRSRKGVTDGVNFLFTQLMSERVGELDYGGEDALTPGASFVLPDEAQVELHVFDLSACINGEERLLTEAEQVAGRIAAMIRDGVLVEEKGVPRPCKPSDFCILLRSPKERAEIYRDALLRAGVGAGCDTGGGFFASKEIACILSVLRVIDNPHNDVALAGALLSPAFMMTAGDLARIRCYEKNASYYMALRAGVEAGDNSCREAVALIEELRSFGVSTPLYRLVQKIYDRTGLISKVMAYPSPRKRRDNLHLFISYCRQYEAGGYQGLGAFLRLMDRLIEEGSDLPGAQSSGDGGETVRIMSIHKSKGLEFPVVFLCDTARQFNKSDLRSSALTHSQLGFSCVRRDLSTLKQFTTVPHEALKLETSRAQLSEEMRVLYVALTRAKERLVLTAGLSEPERTLRRLGAAIEEGAALPAHAVMGAASYAEWVLLAALRHPDAGKLRLLAGLPSGMSAVIDGSESRWRVEIEAAAPGEEKPPAPVERKACADPALTAALISRVDFVYPYERASVIPSKLSVSQVVREGPGHRFLRRPSFLRHDELSPAQRGNAIHKFMQFADFLRASQAPEEEIERLTRLQFISEQEAKWVDPEKVRRFFASGIGKRMLASPRLMREYRFLGEVSAQVAGGEEDEEPIAIQGVMDCLFYEGDEVVIVDYKTDRVQAPEELCERYEGQLSLYEQIARQRLGCKVKEKVIYSFHLNREIPLSSR